MQARTNSRLAAVQALYQMEAGGAGVESVILEFRTHRLGGDIDGRLLHEADEDYFVDLLRGVVRLQAKIDPQIEKRLAKSWTLARLDSTARAILRAAAYELIHRAETPARAIINEYLELANAFLGEDDPRFINAVLDAMARDIRADEFAGDQARRP
ncbi:MAG: transcription antitermination factor NusB [Alphaproteobacteria bacterium RIFCSPHIGHO2_12_FULL_63_12]|nr:MAG: transcription antitermination factor NusB [Alphaproteobacteria bacterium RIFCSPHIGHO2_12_FULL_63_12]